MQHKIDFALMSGPWAVAERLCQGLFAFRWEVWGWGWEGDGEGEGGGSGIPGEGLEVSRLLQVIQ